jgi:hypothetical protein
MGTLSKNFDRFGNRIGDRVGDLRSSVSHKLEDLGDKAASLNRHEGSVTSRLENLTSALPSSTWLALAGTSIVGSIVLKAFGKSHAALFVGGLAPTFLLIGVYNKLVKLHGSDRFSM